MRSVKRYNLSQNAGFNNARTPADRRAYRAMIKRCMPGDPLWAAYLAVLLKAGNKSASFPSFEEWLKTMSKNESTNSSTTTDRQSKSP